jgi:hypothetical protein
MINQPGLRERMFELIEQWQQSGLSQKAFCEQHSTRYYVFHYWYKRYRQNKEEGNNSSFVKLQIAKPAGTSSVEIIYPGGIRLLFHEPVSSNYLKGLIS